MLAQIPMFTSKYQTRKHLLHEAGSESLENYFQKGALFGQTVALNLWFRTSIPGQFSKNSSRTFEDLSYLAFKIQKRTNV